MLQNITPSKSADIEHIQKMLNGFFTNMIPPINANEPPAIEPNNLVCPYSNLFARLDFSQYASTTPTPLYKHKLRNEPPRILPTSTFISNKGINKYSKKGPINAKQKITNANRYFFNPNLSGIKP